MDTFAIITVEPNELVDETTHHDRMPLIVKRADWQRWIEPCDAEQPPIDLLRPFDADRMKAWRADASINNVRNTVPELGMPLQERDEGQIDLWGPRSRPDAGEFPLVPRSPGMTKEGPVAVQDRPSLGSRG